MLKRLDKINTDKLDRRLASVAETLGQDDTEGWRKLLGSRVLKRAKSLAAAIREAGQMYSPERLHAVRIATKKLRYALEIASESGIRPATPLVRLLKRAQDTLGRLHDLQVLQAHVAAVQAAPPSRTLPAGGLETIARALEDECRHLHGRYVVMIRALSESTEAARRVVVPQLVRPSRARSRALKMSLSGRSRRRTKNRQTPTAAAGER
jgi:CHAD domain-containing protein